MAQYINSRLATLDNALFVQVDEQYPDTRSTPVGPTDGSMMMSKNGR